MTFERTPEGWIACPVSPDMERDAKLARQERDGVAARNRWESDTRWTGHLAERVFSDWLRSVGWSFVAHGGIDDLPDFEVESIGLGPVGVGLKCQTVTRRFRPSFEVSLATANRYRTQEPWLVFAAYEVEPRRLLFLGKMLHSTFWDQAVVRLRGAALNPATRTRGDHAFVIASRLEPLR